MRILKFDNLAIVFEKVTHWEQIADGEFKLRVFLDSGEYVNLTTTFEQFNDAVISKKEIGGDSVGQTKDQAA